MSQLVTDLYSAAERLADLAQASDAHSVEGRTRHARQPALSRSYRAIMGLVMRAHIALRNLEDANDGKLP